MNNASSAVIPDVIIIGAGIVGCAIAEQLAQRRLRVHVLDAGGIGERASAAGMGHLVVLGEASAQFALAAYSLELWRRCRPNLPASVEYRQTGTLWLAADDEQVERAREQQRRYADAGIAGRWWTPAELGRNEPALATNLAGAWRVAEDAVIHPVNAARYFAGRARQFGARFQLHAPVAAVTPGEVRLRDGSVLRAPRIVVAAGANTPALLPTLPIVPRKGHLLITTAQVPRIGHQLIETGYHQSVHGKDSASVAFNAQPRPTGQILIGSSRQYDDDDTGVVADVLARMLARAERYLPGIRAWPALRAWAGLRPCTRDGLPYIGVLPQWPGVYVAAGHEGLGITTATGTADALARLLCHESPVLDLAAFDPERIATMEAAA